jgi:catechol 2,3-dioxygenase-like lactoylglutathione lyase family enzyme
MKRFAVPLLALATCCFSFAMAQEVKRPNIRGVSHIALFAHNVDQSLRFYRDFLGFEEQFRLNKPDGDLDLLFVKINDRQSIELFAEQITGSDRLHQIAFETSDVQQMRRYLASCGIKVPDKVNEGRIGNLSFSVKDPDGHTVEFVQYLPGGWTMQDRGKHMTDARISAHLKHIGFMVDSLDRAMRFYRDVLGFQETWRGSSSGTVLSWVNLKVPEGNEYIEFMLYRDPPTQTQLGSMNHLSLEVPDVEEAAKVLESRSARKEYARPLVTRTGINRKRQLNLFDADSSRVELMEPKTVDGIPSKSSTAPPPK